MGTDFAGIPYGIQLSKREEKKREAMENALEWIRNNDPVVEDIPKDDLMIALSKVTGVPLPKMKSREKKKFVEDSITWLRDNEPRKMGKVDDATAMVITQLAGIPYQVRPSSHDKKKIKAMNDSLNWIRNNDPHINDD